MDVDVDTVGVCPELITILDASSLKFNNFVNLFINYAGNPSIYFLDENGGEHENAMSWLCPSLYFILCQ